MLTLIVLLALAACAATLVFQGLAYLAARPGSMYFGRSLSRRVSSMPRGARRRAGMTRLLLAIVDHGATTFVHSPEEIFPF